MFVSQFLIQLKHALLILCSAIFLIRILNDTKSKGTQKLKCIIPTSLPLATWLEISSKNRSRFVWQGLFCTELCWLALIIFVPFNNLLIESLSSFPIISPRTDVGLSILGVQVSPACPQQNINTRCSTATYWNIIDIVHGSFTSLKYALFLTFGMLGILLLMEKKISSANVEIK